MSIPGIFKKHLSLTFCKNFNYNRWMPALEVITTTLEDALAAQEGGAQSLEICFHPEMDGLTPPITLVKTIRDAVKIDINVIIRPHAQSFVYNLQDHIEIFSAIEALKPLGIQSIVFGAHDEQGMLDLDLIETVIDFAKPLNMTLHRALERSKNPGEGLLKLAGRANRVLTSGPAENAYDGMIGLLEWVNYFGLFYTFVAAGGITKTNIQEIALTSGVDQVHVGRAALINGKVHKGQVRELVHLLEQLPK